MQINCLALILFLKCKKKKINKATVIITLITGVLLTFLLPTTKIRLTSWIKGTVKLEVVSFMWAHATEIIEIMIL